MRTWGFLLIIVGIGVTVYSFMMQIAVPADAQTVALMPGVEDGIVNMSLMQRQMMLLHVGLATLIIGAMFYAVAEFRDVLSPHVEAEEE